MHLINTNQQKIFDFIFFSANLRNVVRHNDGSPGRKETVAEHSWHLALICWLLQNEFEKESNVKLDLMKMMKMCLMHDLVEIDAGDPSAWDKDPLIKNKKSAREKESAIKRFGNLPGLLSSEFLALWHEHENGESLEAILVKAVDRLNPAIMRYLTGQGWSDVGADAQMLDKLQLPRVGKSEILSELYQNIRNNAIKQGLLPP
jgi:putative hydrolase of HD superfamily